MKRQPSVTVRHEDLRLVKTAISTAPEVFAQINAVTNEGEPPGPRGGDTMDTGTQTTGPQALGFDPDALREKYRRSATSACARTAPISTSSCPGSSPATPRTTPTSSPASPAPPITDEIEVAIIGGGFSGLLAGARLPRRASRTSGSSRPAATSAAPGTGTAIPARSATSSRYCYLPLLEELGYMPEGEVLLRHGDLRALPAHRPRTTASTTSACFQTRVRSVDWDDDLKRWHITHQPRRRHQGALRRHGARHRDASQAAGHPGHRRLRGPHLPHQPLGLRLHRRRHQRRDDQARRQAGRHHRHRRHRDPVRARASAQHAKHLYVFQRTPSSVDCAATSRPIRSGRRRSSPAGSAQRRENFAGILDRASPSRRTWSTTAGPTSSATSWPHPRARTSR